MKKLFIFVLSIVLLTACSPAVNGFVQLPDAERIAITTLVVAVLG